MNKVLVKEDRVWNIEIFFCIELGNAGALKRFIVL